MDTVQKFVKKFVDKIGAQKPAHGAGRAAAKPPKKNSRRTPGRRGKGRARAAGRGGSESGGADDGHRQSVLQFHGPGLAAATPGAAHGRAARGSRRLRQGCRQRVATEAGTGRPRRMIDAGSAGEK